MAGRLAILAGEGALPGLIADACPGSLFVELSDAARAPAGTERLRADPLRLGDLLAALAGAGVRRVVMAGGLHRPDMDASEMDARTAAHAAELAAVMAGGDDALLRWLIDLFEAEGYGVVAAADLLPDLLADEGRMAGPAPGEGDRADIARGKDILAALAPVDVGQAVVVAGGICLGIETIGGTDRLLAQVAGTPAHLRRGRGVLVKAAKAGQDLRADFPVIGPDTVAAAAAAGLAGIALGAGGVLILERERTLAAADDAGLFVVGT